MNTAEQIAQKVAKESEGFGWSLSPEFIEALADELQVAQEAGQSEGFEGVETLLYALSGATQNAR